MKHLHIVSLSPRSGTTLLMELMTCSFEIDMFPEHEARIGEVPMGNCSVYLTKSPKDVVVIGPIVKIFKNIFTIVVLRDPRDSAVSVHSSDPSNYYGTLEYWHNYLPYFEKFKNHKRVLTIRYEDLVSNPDEIQRTIQNKFPFLKQKDLFSNYLKHANPTGKSKLALNGLREIEKKSIGNWKNHLARLKGEILKHGAISQGLIDYGYESDANWEKTLDKVEPDYENQHHSIFSTKKFIAKKQRSQILRIPKVWFYHSPLFLFFTKHKSKVII